MKDVLSVTLKAKMSRFNHASMHRADSDLMNLIPFDAEKISYAGFSSRPSFNRPKLVGRAITVMKSYRFEPRVAFRLNPPLFSYFSLKHMCLRAIGSKRWVGVRNER
jgi:hypothetical protein